MVYQVLTTILKEGVCIALKAGEFFFLAKVNSQSLICPHCQVFCFVVLDGGGGGGGSRKFQTFGLLEI